MGNTENTAANIKFPEYSREDESPLKQSNLYTPRSHLNDAPRKHFSRTPELQRPAGLPQKPSFDIADQGFTPRSNPPRITRIQDVATSVTPTPPITSPVIPVDEASSAENDWLRERQDARARRQANKKAALARDRAEQQARREKLQAARMRRQADAAAKQKQQQTAIIAKKLTEAIYERFNATATAPRHSGAGRNPARQSEGLDPDLRRGDELGKENLPREEDQEEYLPHPPLSDEAIQSNQRLAESLKKRAGVGDLPKFTSDAINTNTTKAIPEIVALIREVETSDPKQARELYQQTLQGITPKNQRLLESAYESGVAAHQSVDTETHLKSENQSSDTTNTSAQKTQSGTLLARLEEMDAIYNESGFEGLVDTYGPEIGDALSDLARYVNDPENAENVSSIAFETVLGVDPTDPNLKDAGLTAILGAMASKRARQMKVGAKLAKQLAQEIGRGSEKSTMASKGVNMYNGPTIDRPFEKDYPNGYQADKAGNLTHDIDGRELDSGGRIAGHRVVQGSEEAIPPEELKPIAKEGTG